MINKQALFLNLCLLVALWVLFGPAVALVVVCLLQIVVNLRS